MTTIKIDNELVTTNSSVNTTTSSGVGVERLTTLTTNTVVDPTIATTFTPSALAANESGVIGAAAITSQTGIVPSAALPPANQLGVTQPIGYKFNLPPHDWSLPLRPGTVDPDLVGKTDDASFHGLRRGRIWYWAGSESLTSNASSTTTSGSTVSGSTNTSSSALVPIDNAWGFQFLWNPTTISTNVSRNMDITPSNADRLRVVAGVFPGQETVNLEIILDRTNDFACAKADGPGSAKDYVRYYNSLYPGADTSQNMVQQINNLMLQGTMADLEYLFKAINGSGNGNLEWTNLLGKRTANIGYLAPTLLGIQLGPTLNNLSYVGWASNVSINHIFFTENMIPIRTEVSIAIQCFAGSGLTSGG